MSTIAKAHDIKKQRNSNLELFRIIVMLFIIVHHYVVNSGLLETILEKSSYLWSDYFLVAISGFGKIGINCFVMITGYFMCTSSISGKKYFKLLFEIMFYKIAIYAVFYVLGYETLSGGALLRTFLPFVTLKDGFSECFLVFYLLIPFLNILVNNMDRRKHFLLMLLLLCVYSAFSFLPWFEISYNYITWFAVLYIIASFLRKHPVALLEKKTACGLITLGLFVLCMLSVVASMYLHMGSNDYSVVYKYVADSPKPLAVLFSIFAFSFFKNVNVKQSKFINTVSATTFGVLLIHSNSDAMRTWLWGDLLRVNEMYSHSLNLLYVLGCCVAVFIVCSVIDIGRIYLVEAPAIKLYDKVYNKFKKKA